MVALFVRSQAPFDGIRLRKWLYTNCQIDPAQGEAHLHVAGGLQLMCQRAGIVHLNSRPVDSLGQMADRIEVRKGVSTRLPSGVTGCGVEQGPGTGNGWCTVGPGVLAKGALVGRVLFTRPRRSH